MIGRLDWLKLNLRRGRPTRVRARVLRRFVAFEFYYWLSSLLSNRPRHFLDPMPAELRGLRAGDRYLVIWPSLPLLIRLLDRIFYPTGHATFAPYAPETAERAKSEGRRTVVQTVMPGVFRVVGGSS